MEPSNEVVADGDKVFRRLLANTLVTGVTSSFLWFALTFWVYLETRSVVATGVIGGAFSLSIGGARRRSSAPTSTATASTRPWCWPRRLSARCFVGATVVFVAVDADHLLDLGAALVLAARRPHPARVGGGPACAASPCRPA